MAYGLWPMTCSLTCKAPGTVTLRWYAMFVESILPNQRKVACGAVDCRAAYRETPIRFATITVHGNLLLKVHQGMHTCVRVCVRVCVRACVTCSGLSGALPQTHIPHFREGRHCPEIKSDTKHHGSRLLAHEHLVCSWPLYLKITQIFPTAVAFVNHPQRRHTRIFLRAIQ